MANDINTKTNRAQGATQEKGINMATTTFTVTDPLGIIHTRKSQSRTYTHAVVIFQAAVNRCDSDSCNHGTYDNPGTPDTCSHRVHPDRWTVEGWNGREDLAIKLYTKVSTSRTVTPRWGKPYTLTGSKAVILEAVVSHVTKSKRTPEAQEAINAKSKATRLQTNHLRNMADLRADLSGDYSRFGKYADTAKARDEAALADHDLTCDESCCETRPVARRVQAFQVLQVAAERRVAAAEARLVTAQDMETRDPQGVKLAQEAVIDAYADANSLRRGILRATGRGFCPATDVEIVLDPESPSHPTNGGSGCATCAHAQATHLGDGPGDCGVTTVLKGGHFKCPCGVFRYDGLPPVG